MSTLTEVPPCDANSEYHAALACLSLKDENEEPMPGSRREINEAREHLAAARDQAQEDPELLAAIDALEARLDESLERRFTGSPWMLGIVGLFITIFFLYPAYSGLTKDDLTAEQGEQQRTSVIASYQHSIEQLQTSTLDEAQREKSRQHYEEEIAELEAMTGQDYADQRNSRAFWSGLGSLRNGLLWVGFLVAYYFASRPPQFLIVRRRREMAALMVGSGIVKKVIFGILGAVLAMPVTTTITKWNDGSTTKESDLGPVLMIKALVVAVAFLFVSIVMMYALLPLTILNYFRNYQEEKIARFTEPVFNRVKAIFA